VTVPCGTDEATGTCFAVPMAKQITRRSVLVGAGVVAGVGAFGTDLLSADASPGAPTGPLLESSVTSELPPLTPGLSYVLLDGAGFVPDEPSTHPRLTNTGFGYTTTAAFRLWAALVVPAGSQLREISIAYSAAAPASGAALLLFRQHLGGVMEGAGMVPLPESSSPTVATAPLAEVVDGTSTYNLHFFVGMTNPTAFLYGVRVGYVPPPQAFVQTSPAVRVLDTRITGGKLSQNEERVVSLGVPGFARGAVINVTVTGTEGAGYVAVFPADTYWPGNSSVNWSDADQNVANSAIAPVDPDGRIIVRAGVNPTHVVIDVVGYLL